jgi:ketosteroid isomerase-like protein
MGSRNLDAFHRLEELAGFEHDITSKRSRQAVAAALTPDYVIIEPPSLPHGGVHEGVEAWLAMNARMRSLWQQQDKTEHLWDVPEDDIIVRYSSMEWTSKATGRTVRFPSVQVLHFRDGRIAKVEMFVQDTKLILDTLEPN